MSLLPRGISSVGRAVASHATGQGFESPMLQLKQETESESNLVRFCFALIFNTHAHLGIAGGFAKATPTLALASDAAAMPSAKRFPKVKKPKHA